MGRGRAKAKQTKVARDLKYRTWETDLGSLERELKEEKSHGNGHSQERDDSEDYQPGESR